MRVPVFVQCDEYNMPLHKREMRRFGLSWNRADGFDGSASRRMYENLIRPYCNRERLKCRIDNEYGSRSTDYRKTFFKNNKPAIGNMYFCAYCGKLLTHRKLTVDHLYPVGCAKDSIYLQKKLARMGIKNINDAANLVAACFNCNRKKSAHMGAWIRRGKIGRHKEVWFVRHFIRLSLFAAASILFIHIVNTGDISILKDIFMTLKNVIVEQSNALS